MAARQNNETRRNDLGDFESGGDDRPPFYLTVPELKLLGIAGVSLTILLQWMQMV